MQRYLIRIRNGTGYAPKETVQVLIRLRKEVEQFRSVVKNLRISENAMEFDLYTIDEQSKVLSTRVLERTFGPLLTERNLAIDEQLDSKENVVKIALNLFNEERYWECHETLEQIWRREKPGLEKETQQGIILAASALVHLQKNESEVCLGMIPRALAKLDQWNESKYFDLNVEKLTKS